MYLYHGTIQYAAPRRTRLCCRRKQPTARIDAVLLGGPWAAAWLPQWSLGGSVAAAGGVQRYYAHVALPEDLVSIRAAETTYRYMRTPSQAVTRVS